MASFKFASGGNLVVETSDDEATIKPFAETIDTWTAGSDSGRRRMPRDSGTFVRFRDSSSSNTTGWLDLRGNVDSYGYAVKDSGGFWYVHVGRILNDAGQVIDPAPQSPSVQQ